MKFRYRRGPLGWFARGLDATRRGYGRIVGLLVRAWFVPLAVLAAAFFGACTIFVGLPATFLPDEDQGALFLDIRLPDAAPLDRTSQILRQVQATLAATEGVDDVISSGQATSDTGRTFACPRQSRASRSSAGLQIRKCDEEKHS